MTINDSDLRRLLDERTIERVLNDYCRAIDRGDVELLKTVYHPDAVESHGPYQGPATGFIQSFAEGLGPDGHHSTTHTISNIRIEFDGDVARVETYVNAHHTLADPETRQIIHESLGNRYLDRFERRNCEWRIAARRVAFDWARTEPATERSYFTRRPSSTYLIGIRSLSDPSYSWE